jgi:transcriptional regulator with XRE-family HTH domain
MRLWLVSGSTLANIGKAFGVTQQAVSRWLADARAKVVTDVQRDLAGRLKIAKDELPDVARLLESHVDISISRLLGRGQG